MVRAVICVPRAEGSFLSRPGAAEGRSFPTGERPPPPAVPAAVAPPFAGGAVGSALRLGRRLSKVPSLLFDMDLDVESGAAPSASGGSAMGAWSSGEAEDVSLAKKCSQLAALLEPWNEVEAALLLHVRIAREEAARAGRALAPAELAARLAAVGYAARLCVAEAPEGGGGGACLRHLRHSFLVVALPQGDGEAWASGRGGSPHGPWSSHVVVDPRFREQFEIAHAHAAYAALLERVPQDVAVSRERLEAAVGLLCAQMAAAFRELGLALPPWRHAAAALSKWHARRSRPAAREPEEPRRTDAAASRKPPRSPARALLRPPPAPEAAAATQAASA